MAFVARAKDVFKKDSEFQLRAVNICVTAIPPDEINTPVLTNTAANDLHSLPGVSPLTTGEITLSKKCVPYCM